MTDVDGSDAGARTWVVWRQDEHGNRAEVARHVLRADAEAQAAGLEARGHKQTYWVAGTTTTDVVEAAVAEARRRGAASDRDVSAAVEHFAGTVRETCTRWGLTAERWLDGGAGMPTLAVVGEGGQRAVLKIAEPGDQDVAARIMTAAHGRGYARVLDWDAGRGALLLERLGPMLSARTRTLHEQGPVVVALLQQAWQVPLDSGRPFEGKASGLLSILADLGPRYGAAHGDVLRQATLHAERLAATERPEVVCHGDPHANNVLRRGEDWALIDPDGFVGERSYDVAVVVRDACAELAAAEAAAPGSATTLLRSECRRLAGSAGADPERVWAWAYVERVTSGLYLRWHGYTAQASQFLDVATLLEP
ncbi:aminoglycoside phosphotransferase family protein [Kineosporia sp. A_224]|uniref:aminoglycoside phosphotransferase family protein n=1 Tax=Kineosporia sp. A_224 TaxID=1962180 RepID=UPI000B4B4080|nr:aminoglycoside phosphotransferase family protein [Kineosporia sp. A_224]